MSDNTNMNDGGINTSHRRRVFWGLLFGTALLLTLFFIVPNFVDTPQRISEETTILTEPRTPDGRRIDYLAALEERFAPKNTAGNGFREIAAATGRVPMENISQDYWDEMCRKLDIDSLAPPTMPFVVWAERPLYEAAHRESGSEEPFEKSPGEIASLPPELQNSYYAWNLSNDVLIRQWQEKYMAEPWSNDDFPELGECIDTLSPSLDLVGQAVRKDVYYIPVVTVRASCMYDILLPCVQSQRQFGRYLVIRANRSLQAGDLDAAWYDLLSALRLGRHLKNDLFLVTNLVGSAIEAMTLPVVQDMLSHEDVTSEQLRQWLGDLKNLPSSRSVEDAILCEQFAALDHLADMASGVSREYISNIPKEAGEYLGFNWPFCARLLNRHFEKQREIFAKNLTPAERKAEFDAWYDASFPKGDPDEIWVLLSKGYRSRFVIDSFAPATIFYYAGAFMTPEVKTQLLIFAIELELEKRQNGRYPATLDVLSDRYSPEQFSDPFGKGNFVYQPDESGDAYLLYSVGPNGVDDGGKCDTKNPVYAVYGIPSGTTADDIVVEMR